MQQVDPGFDPRGLSTFQLYLPETSYPEGGDQVGFLRTLSDELTAIPGVESASAMSGLPPRRRLNANDMDAAVRIKDAKPRRRGSFLAAKFHDGSGSAWPTRIDPNPHKVLLNGTTMSIQPSRELKRLFVSGLLLNQHTFSPVLCSLYSRLQQLRRIR